MSKLKLSYDLLGTLVTVVLLNVVEVEGAEPTETEVNRFSLDAASFPAVFTTGDEAVTKSLAGYGLQKLIQDRTSQVSGDTQKKFDAMLAEGERLMGGEWRSAVERSSGGATPKADPILAQAVAELQNLTIPVATAALSKLTAEQIKVMKDKPAVKAKCDEIREAAKSAEAVDLSDLFAE